MAVPAAIPLRAARPTVAIDGSRVAELEAGLLAYLLEDSLSGIASAEVTFGNWGGPDGPGFRHFGRDTLEFGRRLSLALAGASLFEGRITALEGEFPEGGAPRITVLAEDALQDLRMTRRTRVFENRSLADIARTIAADHGLEADIRLADSARSTIAQLNLSDLAFLDGEARPLGAEVRIADGRLTLDVAGRGTAIPLRWSGTLREFRATADLAGQRTRIAAAGWDPGQKTPASHEATADILASELDGGESGPALLARIFGERRDTLAHLAPATAAEARALAEAVMRQRARAFLSGEGIAETDAALKAGATVALAGLGPLFDGDWRLTAVTHLFDTAEGARSHIRCTRAGLGREGQS